MTNKNRIGSKPIDPVLVDTMNNLARDLDVYFNGTANLKKGKRKTGFILMAFPFGHQGRCNYISNTSREDVIVLLKEQLAYFEGQPEIEGNA